MQVSKGAFLLRHCDWMLFVFFMCRTRAIYPTYLPTCNRAVYGEQKPCRSPWCSFIPSCCYFIPRCYKCSWSTPVFNIGLSACCYVRDRNLAAPNRKIYVWFLGAVAKLRKATICFVMSVRPSTWNNSALTRRIFMKFYIWGFFENVRRNFKFCYNMTRITGTLHEDRYTFLIITRSFLYCICTVHVIRSLNCQYQHMQNFNVTG